MNKININVRLFLWLIPFAMISCEEVIEIDLNSSDPAIVAEGYMEEDSVCTLKLSYTSDYFDNESSLSIEDAIVRISTQGGAEEELDYMGNGIYSGLSMQGLINTDYTLHVILGVRSFTGSSKLMPPANILAIKYEEVTFGPPGQGDETPYALTVSFQNYKDQTDNYMLKITRNGEPYGSLYYLVTDKYSLTSDTLQYISMMLPFYMGDKVALAVYSIDEETYGYYRQMNDINGGGMPMSSSTPYNPPSNMGEDILGYFSARSRIDSSFVLH
jgi:hypothetical protein